MLKGTVKGIQIVNLITLVAQILNDLTGVSPAIQTAHWFLAAQALIGVLLPGPLPQVHQVVFNAPQDPKSAAKK